MAAAFERLAFEARLARKAWTAAVDAAALGGTFADGFELALLRWNMMKDAQPPQMAMSNCDDVEQWMVSLTSPALKFDFLLRHNVGVLDVGSKLGGEDRS